ncbi:MAG: hypothetical protein ABWY12_16425 [Burkholderiales bacterium]
MSTTYENDSKASEAQPSDSDDEELSRYVLVVIYGALTRSIDNTL